MTLVEGTLYLTSQSESIYYLSSPFIGAVLKLSAKLSPLMYQITFLRSYSGLIVRVVFFKIGSLLLLRNPLDIC